MQAREMAATSVGRNALTAGLLCHAAAILVGMMTASGADVFFKIVYPFSWVLMTLGAYAELRLRSGRPLKSWRFYGAAMASVFPLLGPPAVFGLIYTCPEEGREGQAGLSGFVAALLRLRANLLLLFGLSMLLFLLFAVVTGADDPYFRRK
ncbi:MAG TPA: hypothetical protein PLZ82_07675 [Smithellaceae bacterium]|jgi:hypothetical protein|nr:hypothetical protein [Syntrophaceae bacterium]HOH57623.1 hypothetical protein [Smithellaceae bacterium]MBP8664961.1 hypothetical protein [Syntrophaceae bacterium]HOU56066.1 hypothetical protein [Smithellaceae bacterium]HQG98891.1 hypothetical protein [Smithellaceae bacterium]